MNFLKLQIVESINYKCYNSFRIILSIPMKGENNENI